MPEFEQDPVLDFLFAEAKLGIQMDEWLSTDVGRYVTGRAKNELEGIQIKLLSIPAWQEDSAKHLQQKAQGLQQMMGWLTDAINNGHASELALQEAEDSME